MGQLFRDVGPVASGTHSGYALRKSLFGKVLTFPMVSCTLTNGATPILDDNGYKSRDTVIQDHASWCNNSTIVLIWQGGNGAGEIKDISFMIKDLSSLGLRIHRERIASLRSQ